MNIVDEVVNKIDIIEECKGWRQFYCGCLLNLTQLSLFPNVALCEVNHRPRGKRGALSKHNANKKFMFRSSGANQCLLQKIFVCERDCYFSFLFFSKKKGKLLCDRKHF